MFSDEREAVRACDKRARELLRPEHEMDFIRETASEELWRENLSVPARIDGMLVEVIHGRACLNAHVWECVCARVRMYACESARTCA